MNHTSLYLFNPENDLAVASGMNHYMAPPLARLIASDLALLPLWYAPSGSALWVGDATHATWMAPQRAHLGMEHTLLTTAQLTQSLPSLEGVTPWGWSSEVLHRFKRVGVAPSLLPTTEAIAKCRSLSHRSLSVELFNYLEHHLAGVIPFPHVAPCYLHSDAEVQRFVESAPHLLLKAPWSGSGKGLYWGRGVYDTSLSQWARGILRRQGELIGEYHYNKQVDFAMEFCCLEGGDVSFAGYSLFETNAKGVYQGNRLAANETIEQQLSEQVALSSLQKVQELICSFLSERVAPHYRGYLGVDMMLYLSPNGVEMMLHPCVEINLRMNMGIVARLLTDNYLHPVATGRYMVDYEKEEGALLRDHIARTSENPLRMEEGKLRSGYLSLCPITPHTHYRARVELE